MRSSRVFLVAAALALATAMSVLPTQVASAQPPSTAVVVPATGATVSSTQVVLDATASAGVTQVKFELTGGTLNDWVIATATPTIYGWAALWNSTTVVSGTYTLQSVATSEGSSTTSTGISITVENGAPTMSFVLPPPSGGTVSGTQLVFDAVGPAGVTSGVFALQRRNLAVPRLDRYPNTCTFVRSVPPPVFTGARAVEQHLGAERHLRCMGYLRTMRRCRPDFDGCG